MAATNLTGVRSLADHVSPLSPDALAALERLTDFEAEVADELAERRRTEENVAWNDLATGCAA